MSNSASAKRAPRANPDASLWHEPVLREEVLDLLQPAPGRVFLDGTLGGGGHSEALLAAGAKVVALDRDRESLEHASERLATFGDRFLPVQSNFADAAENPAVLASAPYDGALLDLGVSSHQLDTPERGFSFRHDGPLDMRMDPSTGEPAALLVNSADETELTRLFRECGEEPQARRVARAIVAERERCPSPAPGNSPR
jgi:16S rRNA (cytosine1402-N4)-methyltransferase